MSDELPSPREEPEPLGERRAAATAEVAFASGPDETWQKIVDADLTRVLTGTRLLPAVARVSGDGAWGEAGLARALHLSDGSSLRELILAADPPRDLRYRLYAITGPLGRLTRGAAGVFHLEPRDGETLVTWTYSYDARSALAYPLVRVVIARLWQPYMQRSLERLRDLT